MRRSLEGTAVDYADATAIVKDVKDEEFINE